MATQYAISAIEINKATGTDLFSRQIMSRGIDLGVTLEKNHSDGKVEPREVFIPTVNPTLSVTTTDVLRHMAAIGYDGYTMGSADTMRLWFQPHASLGVLVGGGSDLQMAIDKALVVIDSISMPAGTSTEATTIQYTVYPVSSDGLTDPFTVSASETAAEDATPAEERYYLHSVEYKGEEIPGISSCELSLGYTINDLRDAGRTWCVEKAIRGRDPVLNIETMNMEYLNTLSTLGATYTTGELNIWLQKGANNGISRVEPSAESHIKIYSDKGKITPMSASGENSGASLSLQIDMCDEEGEASINWTTGVAIT